MNRRRFLSIVAATGAAGLTALLIPRRTQWRGLAMGAEASVSIEGDGADAKQALSAVTDTIRRMERLFSLYDPSSALSRLNREGELLMPAEFARLVEIAPDFAKLTWATAIFAPNNPVIDPQ